jgi:hypothetical protein
MWDLKYELSVTLCFVMKDSLNFSTKFYALVTYKHTEFKGCNEFRL